MALTSPQSSPEENPVTPHDNPFSVAYCIAIHYGDMNRNIM